MAKSRVTLFDSRVETIVGGHFAGRFPYALNRIEFWTIRRKSEKFDFIEVFRQPRLSGFVQPMTRPIVNDHKDLLRSVMLYDSEQELMESVSIEYVGELVKERRVLYSYRPEYMSGFA